MDDGKNGTFRSGDRPHVLKLMGLSDHRHTRLEMRRISALKFVKSSLVDVWRSVGIGLSIWVKFTSVKQSSYSEPAGSRRKSSQLATRLNYAQVFNISFFLKRLTAKF